MSLDVESIGKGIHSWATDISGLTVIWNRPNQERPKKRPYVSLSFLTGPVRIGQAEERVDADTGDSFMLYQYEINISAIVYGNDKFDVLRRATDLKESLSNPLVLGTLRVAGISVFEDGNIQDVSSLLESGFEERAQMDIRFGLCSTQQFDPGAIETVEVSGLVEGRQDISVGPVEITKP